MDESGWTEARRWIGEHGPTARLLPHGDADGLAAGVLLARQVGGPVMFSDPFSDELPAGALVVVDQGVRRVRADGPALFVDHHADPEPVDATVVSDPNCEATSLLAWRLLGEPSDGAWLAGLGLLGDLGQAAVRSSGLPVGPLAPLGRLATLCSAAGRLRQGPLADAFTALAESADARTALTHPATRELVEAKEEIAALRRSAGRVPPRVGADAALIELDVPARVHSQVASAWAGRLAPRPVVVANRGWRAEHVSFAVRSADGRDLRSWLRRTYTPPPNSGDYGRGHARATGGSLTPEAYEEFVSALGLDR